MNNSYLGDNICQVCGNKRRNIDFSQTKSKRSRMNDEYAEIMGSMDNLSLENNNNGLLKNLIDRITNLEHTSCEISNSHKKIKALEKTIDDQDYLINSLKDDVSCLKREISEFRNFMDI